jgi:hypothetical protein
MNRLKCVSLALLALFLIAALPALAFASSSPAVSSVGNHHALKWVLVGGVAALGLVGTVTQTYTYPGSGTVAATAAQAAGVYMQSCYVNFADADTTATVTHNWGIGTTGAFPNTAQLMPEVFITPGAVGTAFPAIGVSAFGANTITLGKANTTTGSGGTVVVYMRKPHSIGQ